MALRTQNVSEQNQKHFLCPGHKVVHAGKRGNSICVGNNVSATMCPRLPGPKYSPELRGVVV